MPNPRTAFQGKEEDRLTCFAEGAFPSITTNALVGVDAINARATIFTRVALTIIDVCNELREEHKGGGKTHTHP